VHAGGTWLRKDAGRATMRWTAHRRRDPVYVIGRSEDETRRLEGRAKFFEPLTRHLFQDAGICAGMRVARASSRVHPRSVSTSSEGLPSLIRNRGRTGSHVVEVLSKGVDPWCSPRALQTSDAHDVGAVSGNATVAHRLGGDAEQSADSNTRIPAGIVPRGRLGLRLPPASQFGRF
jgi:hypothetical protein